MFMNCNMNDDGNEDIERTVIYIIDLFFVFVCFWLKLNWLEWRFRASWSNSIGFNDI